MNDSPATGRAGRYTLIGIAAILVVALAGFLWLVVLAPRAMDFAGGPHVALPEYHGDDPTGVPAQLKSAGLIERGEYLTRAADCAACHSAEGGTPFAGGRAFVLPFGTLYSTNITPTRKRASAITRCEFPGRHSQGDRPRQHHNSIRRCPSRATPT